MRSTPISTARRSTRMHSCRSAGSPQTPGPVICMAPKPRRWTVRSPGEPAPKVKVPLERTGRPGRPAAAGAAGGSVTGSSGLDGGTVVLVVLRPTYRSARGPGPTMSLPTTGGTGMTHDPVVATTVRERDSLEPHFVLDAQEERAAAALGRYHASGR